jgi:SET domain-containing protein
MSRPKSSRPSPSPASPAQPARINGSHVPAQLYSVRRSAIHGRGVFAAQPIRKGTRIIEYKGRRVDWDWASREYAPVEGEPTHTFLFQLDDGRVIDANQGGNAARWINHSCNPNCEAVEEEGRVYIEALRAIRPGEELGYDYRIQIEERLTPTEKRRWPCHCGAKKCRGTLLVPKRR